MSRTFAYARVSTIEQEPENQIREIEVAGFSIEPYRIITETVSGSVAIAKRRGFNRLLDKMERGDVLIVTKLDRLGRDAMDVSQTVAKLEKSGIKTLKAFGQIIKSLFILRYINDVELRQAIEKQLNKVELSNKFARAVAVGSPREYAQTEKEEQEMAEGCNRLIKNSIICWNYLYLERQLEKLTDPEAKENLLRMIATHSPITWAHINMLGEYDFSDEKLRDSVGILPLKSTP
ncbi:unnamed protein product [Cyprideis torosa]|uniref:Uncharacterized protein n=1 Tax=Cyprideis torosa TaxID=163714 RepID=A0A7R8WN57_9CRUS|nr:unnamed protein product [Cyprideis torosa]CAG0905836.1 unnamed protein product [Cyprideis torosa]